MAKAFLAFDPPALAPELRHRIKSKAEPLLRLLHEAIGNPTGVTRMHLERPKRLQPEPLETLTRRALSPAIAAANDDATILEGAQLAPRVVRINQSAAVKEAEHRQIDTLRPVCELRPPITPASLAIDEHEARNGRIFPDFLDKVAARLRQSHARQFALKSGAHRLGLDFRDRRRRQRNLDEWPG